MHSSKYINIQEIVNNQGQTVCFSVTYINGVDLGALVKEVDGFYVWYPNRKQYGFWSAYVLRDLADILDDLNKDYEKEINEYFDRTNISRLPN